MSQVKKESTRRKITWNMMYQDFRQRHPNLRKKVVHWYPHSYSTIEIWLKDRSRLLYNYDNHRAEFIKKGE